MTDMNEPEGQTLSVHDIGRQKREYYVDKINYFPSRDTCTFPTDGYALVRSDEATAYPWNPSLSLPPILNTHFPNNTTASPSPTITLSHYPLRPPSHHHVTQTSKPAPPRTTLCSLHPREANHRSAARLPTRRTATEHYIPPPAWY